MFQYFSYQGEANKLRFHDLSKPTTSPFQAGSTPNPNTPTTTEIVEQKNPRRIFENVIPYKVEKFLELVLGEEFYSTSVTSGNPDIRTETNLNATELLSDDISQSRGYELPKTPQSAPSKSTLQNKLMSVYRSMSQKIKKKLRPRLIISESVEKPEIPWNPYSLVNIQLDDKLQSFCRELNIQQTIIYQASKAIDYCNFMKTLGDYSYELRKLNRLILLANLQKQAIFEAMKNFSSRPETQSSSKDWVELTISQIDLYFKQFKEEIICKRSSALEIYSESILVVVSQGLTVLATQEWLYHDSHKVSTYSIDFSNLNLRLADFKISFKVYSLKIPKVQNKTLSHKKNSHAPLSPKCLEVKFSGIRKSSYKLIGSFDLQLNNFKVMMNKIQRHLEISYPLRQVPKDSVLKKTITLCVDHRKLHISTFHSGFLLLRRVGADDPLQPIDWDRKWCILEGHFLVIFANDSPKEGERPLQVYNLMKCVSDKITDLDFRTACTDTRPFFIQFCQPRNVSYKLLLQCETKHDFIEWTTKLNYVLSVLCEWNMNGTAQPLNNQSKCNAK